MLYYNKGRFKHEKTIRGKMNSKLKRTILIVIIGLVVITGGLLFSSPAQAATMTKAERIAKATEIRNTYTQSIQNANIEYRQAIASALETRRLAQTAAQTSIERIAASRSYIQSITTARLKMILAKRDARFVYSDGLRTIHWLNSGSSKSGEGKGA